MIRQTTLITALVLLASGCGTPEDDVQLIEALRAYGTPDDCSVDRSRGDVTVAKRPDGALPENLTLVVGAPEMLAEQWKRPRWISFVPIRHHSTESESGVELVQPTRKAEHWVPEVGASIEEMGIYETTVFPCEQAVTAEQKRAANRLVTESRAAAERNGWFDYDKAVADGFHRMGGISDHWVHDGFATDGRILDPERPEFLMFHEVNGKLTLTGYMFIMPSIEARGPQIGGPLTIWHYHTMPPACYDNGIVVAYPDEAGTCAEGTKSTKSSEMLHVWFIDRVDGPFASDMTPPGGGRSGHEGHMHHEHVK